MPITRKQLSTAASTSNPPLKPSSSSTSIAANSKTSASVRNLLVSDDDLFEQSAIQVSSASRQTRTINHQIPKEISKKLQGDFIAAATAKSLSSSQEMSKITRTIVKRSSIPLVGSKKVLNANSNVVADNEESKVDDSIFDVPVSPKNSLPAKFELQEQATFITAHNNQNMQTPVKAINAKIVSLTTPSRPLIIANVRRTPLTMAEKKRRQTGEDSVASVQAKQENIEPLGIIDILNGSEPNEPVKKEKGNNNCKKVVIVNKHTSEEKSINALIKTEDCKAEDVEVSFCIDVEEEGTGQPKDENVNSKEKENKKNKENDNKEKADNSEEPLVTGAARRRRVFIRNSATESAPPEIKPAQVVNVCEESNNSVTSSKTVIDEISLVIEVPPPPKLEDLESLDPELYVKLKSGSIKDDPTVPFISESDRVDIENFLESFASPELADSLLPVAIIGEGTFSTVYKVIDRSFYECENSGWLEYSRQNPLDWLRLWRWVYSTSEREDTEKFILYRDGKRCVNRHGKSVHERKSPGAGRLAVLLRRYLLEWAMRSLDSLLPGGTADPTVSVLSSITPRVLQSAMLRFRPYFIALKRINATSSPQRILDEMSFLKHLGGKHNVVPVISGLRSEDQVIVTFPYFYSEEFREFLSSNTLTINSIACYMRSLFISLAHLHAHNVIHRDVKPSNFLYAPENGGRAVLLDFGLAQKASSNSHRSSLAQQHRIHHGRAGEKERKKLQAVNIILNTLGNVPGGLVGDDPCEKVSQLTLQLGPGYFNNDPRAGMKASRAGTRGFRAPEVLFKCSNQTTALDIWSAGVILLTLLTRRYPFFQSSDDFDAIVEIANIFGNEEMSQAAKIYSRRWQCNVPSVPEKHVTWPTLCQKLNPAFFPEIPPECFSLLRECLNLNSEKRITARSALKHEFITKFAK